MIWSNYLYNSSQIDITGANYEIALEDSLNPRELNYSDEIENIESYHGVNASPTYARGRIIGLSWYIISDTRVGFGAWMTYLDNLFKLQSNTGVLQTKIFSYDDDEGNTWNANVKIKTPLKYELEEFDSNHFIRKFIVVLLAPNPKFLSPSEFSQTGEEWFIWGLAITNNGLALTNDWIAINENSWQFIITPPWGNQPSEPRFEITVLRDVTTYLRLQNVTRNNYIQFNIWATAWQKYIIDTENETATLDWVNIMATKTGWNFIIIDWETEIEIYDEDRIYTWNDLDITVYFKNILL